MPHTKHYFPESHIHNLAYDDYYRQLILLRNELIRACDHFFARRSIPKVDLFMLARGVSSPMGKGSDSEPIPMKLGKQNIYLVDSAQFGMEPIVLKHFNAVYCYLPSFRGEDSDDRHLNQFYHCEAEIAGSYLEVMKMVEKLIVQLIKHALTNISLYPDLVSPQKESLDHITKSKFPRILFSDAAKLLSQQKNKDELLETREYGRVITNKGESFIVKYFGNNVPVWITKYDRDTVPFYQKPDSRNQEVTLNADLIFPSINGGFEGEIVGSGQRQDSIKEMKESMKRQNIQHQSAYEWYLQLRNDENYRTTSGFGLGIERFIAWMCGSKSIAEVSIYPVQKNIDVSY